MIVPEGNRKIYMDLLSDLKKKVVKKHGEPNDIILPLECHYLNKNAFISVVGHQPQVGYLHSSLTIFEPTSTMFYRNSFRIYKNVYHKIFRF